MLLKWVYSLKSKNITYVANMTDQKTHEYSRLCFKLVDSGWIRTPYKGTDTYRRHKLPFHQHSAWRKRRYDDRSSADGEDYNVSEESYVSSSSKSSPPRVGSPSRKERMSPKYSSDNSNRGLQENQTSLEGKSFWKMKGAILDLRRDIFQV